MDSTLGLADHLLPGTDRGALATVIRTSGSAPQRPGARLLLRSDGSTGGTVGGGKLEQLVLRELQALLDAGGSRLIKVQLTRDLGMCCGGEMEVFLEVLEPSPRLYLFGAGHVAQATARFAPRVGFHVSVVDDREELNTSDRFPGAELVLLDPPQALRRDRVRCDQGAFLVICTHDHRLDSDTLLACVDKDYAYLGMIGSRRKVLKTFARVQQQLPEADLSRVRAPIGLDLGGHTPEEIGLAITAELVLVRRGGTALPMCEREAGVLGHPKRA